MNTIKTSMKHLLFAMLCSVSVNAQNAKTAEIPARPKFASSVRAVNVVSIDNIVTESFSLLSNVDSVGSRVTAIEEQIKGSIPDISVLLSQINGCNASLNEIESVTPKLADDIVNLVSNIQDQHVPLMKIPLAIRELNEARKAIEYCIAYTKYLLITAIPSIKKQTSSAEPGVITKN